MENLENIVEPKIFNIKQNKNSNISGILNVIENGEHILFNLKRIFYVHGAEIGTIRGNHANMKQAMIILSITGSHKIDLEINSRHYNFNMSSINEYLVVPKKTWIKYEVTSPNSILLVLCHDVFKSNDYINDYNLFKKNESML